MQARQPILSLRLFSARTPSFFFVCSFVLVVSACSKKVPIVEFKRPPVTASVPPAPVEAPEPVNSGEDVETADNQPPESVAEPEPPPPPRPRPRRPAPVEDAVSEPEPTAEPSLDSLNRGLPELAPDTRDKLELADSLLVVVDARPLSSTERQQARSARAFVAQARMAIREGDERRALVLLEKGLLLVEDLERSSR